MANTLRGSLNLLVIGLLVLSSGCTSLRDYVHNGFKVGPNYCPPDSPVAEHWIESTDLAVAKDPGSLSHWWAAFNDPTLDGLVTQAYRQNLTLKQAGFRILQARAKAGIALGEIFPQTQVARGAYTRAGDGALGFSDTWNFGFSLNWELDFWGRFRRAVTAADANLDASMASYDGVLVTLIADVARSYVQVRTDQERIRLLKSAVKLQQGVLNYIENRYAAGYKQTELDLDQAISNVKQNEASIMLLEIDKRQAEDQLCTLMGMPTEDLSKILGDAPIPTAPPQIAIGIPADLLRRRPDIRRAERLAASQAEQIGIAQAALYPALSINGTLGYAAESFSDLFRSDSFNGTVGPSFNWNVLNYGRIVNNVRYNEAYFQELVAAYQNTVLSANQEVEDGLATFLRSHRRTALLEESVTAARKAVKIVILQYEKGAVDFNRYATIEQNLVTQQDSYAQAKGQIAQGLVSVYRALGGGWELRSEETGQEAAPAAGVGPASPAASPETEEIPVPEPTTPKPEKNSKAEEPQKDNEKAPEPNPMNSADTDASDAPKAPQPTPLPPLVENQPESEAKPDAKP